MSSTHPNPLALSHPSFDTDRRSGEPGSTGREPFEEGDLNSGRTGSGLATDSHGGTIARDTEVRDGQVVGLAGPTDVGYRRPAVGMI
jgi:hypothetical protein